MVRVFRVEVRRVCTEVGVIIGVAVILSLHAVARALLSGADCVFAHALAPEVRRGLTDGLAGLGIIGDAGRALVRPPSRRVLVFGCR